MKKLPLTILLLLSACSAPQEVQTAKVARQTVESTIASVNAGTIKAQQTAELAFGTVGRVRTLNIELGDKVKKGEILAEVENNDLLTNLKRAEIELQRRKNMVNRLRAKVCFLQKTSNG